MRCVGHVARTKRCAQSFGSEILSERDDWKNRRRWEDNIEMDPKEMGQKGVECIGVVQGGGEKAGCCESGN